MTNEQSKLLTKEIMDTVTHLFSLVAMKCDSCDKKEITEKSIKIIECMGEDIKRINL